MKILITGGAGFIGSHVAENFLQAGNEVILFDNLSTGEIANVKYLKNKFPKSKILFIKGDVSKKKDFAKIPNGVELIVHLAAIVSVRKSVEDPIETNTVTLGGAINIFEYAKENKIKKIIQASSAAVYGEIKKFPLSEKYSGEFISPYAISKYVCEVYADYYYKTFGIKTVSLRFFNVFGERQQHNSPYSGAIAKFAQAFKEKSEINIFGDGKNIRDYIYVKDIANAIFKIAGKSLKGNSVYNLGTGKGTNLLQLVKTLEKIFGYKVKINFLPAKIGDPRKSLADVSKIKKELGIVAEYSLERGLLAMLDK
jgi:UDP-glucose 4-epimerase